MNPIYESPQARLYHGDAMALLVELGTASASALITDPPYSSGGMFAGDRHQDVRLKYCQTSTASGSRFLPIFTGDTRDQRGFLCWCSLWLAEALRVVEPGGIACVFSDWRQLPVMTDALQSGGWVWRGILPWLKPDARPAKGRFANKCEYVVWGTHGPRPLAGATLPGFVEALAPRGRERIHMTQKPLALLRTLVRAAPQSGVVLDPFAGSAATGVAALAEGRRYLGCELTEHYAQVGAERLRRFAAGDLSCGDQRALFSAEEAGVEGVGVDAALAADIDEGGWDAQEA